MVILSPEKMVIVPPRHYCIIHNPVLRDLNNHIQMDQLGQARLLHADEEVRLQQDPFPLYPGDELKVKVTLLRVVP